MAEERGGLRAVGDAIDAALEPKASAPRVGRKVLGSDIEEPELPLLPPGCPVRVLGMLGQTYHFLDERRQHITLDPQKIGKNHIRSLFGRQSQLCDQYWPRYGENGKQNGWKPEVAGDLLMRACAFEGIFDPQGRIRGRGAHRGRNGELILHCGDAIYIGGDPNSEDGWQEPDMIDGFVYPAAAAIPHPDPTTPSSAPGEQVLALFRTWYWARPLIDPRLLIGWVAAAMIGGAIKWRPHAWVTGSSETGKSTLQGALEALFDGGALHTSDATEAALRQTMKQQTLPVFFDELEASADNRRAEAVINLARRASQTSGGNIMRGGQDHQSHEFVAQACFLFSSILIPPRLSQDKNRMAILELERIPQGVPAVRLDEPELRQQGRALRKRLVDQWPRWQDTFDAYRAGLVKYGHTGRAADQFGALLAAGDLVLWDHLLDDEVEIWCERLRVEALAEKAMDLSDEQEMVNLLATTQLPGRGGDEPWTVSKLVAVALGTAGDAQRERLQYFGMKLVIPKLEDEPDGKGAVRKVARGARTYKGVSEASGVVMLAIANAHEALNGLFEHSRWKQGGWAQATVRLEGAQRRVKIRYAGSADLWSTLIPLAAIVDVSPES